MRYRTRVQGFAIVPNREVGGRGQAEMSQNKGKWGRVCFQSGEVSELVDEHDLGSCAARF